MRTVTLADGRRIDYVIDAQHRRVGKKIDGIWQQAFVWQDPLRPLAELDGWGGWRWVFVYGSKPNVPDFMVDRALTYYRILSDHLGSPRLVINAVKPSA